MRSQIEAFIGFKRIAVIGVSRDSGHFSRAILKEFLSRGYDMALVHPEVTHIDGRPCFRTIAAVQPPVEGALILTAARNSAKAAEDCVRAGITKLWIYQGKQAPAGADAVLGECPMMWLKNTAWVHSLHRGFRSLVGTLPK